MFHSQTREYPSFQTQLLKYKSSEKAKLKWLTGGGKPILQSSPNVNQGGIHIHQELIAAGAQTDPDYYNPSPWARILGRANETDVEIDGVISRDLIDSGAIISMMSKYYCHERGYETQLLEHLLPIEGSGGANVPYLVYVGVRMCIPGINSFDRNLVMLISSTRTKYHKKVPIQVGSHVIDQVTNCISEEELQSLSQSWKTAYVSTIIYKTVLVSDPDFNLDQVQGNVVIREEVTILASQITVVKGLTTITGHHMCVHVLVGTSPKCTTIFILGNISKLKPGNSDIKVVVVNKSR